MVWMDLSNYFREKILSFPSRRRIFPPLVIVGLPLTHRSSSMRTGIGVARRHLSLFPSDGRRKSVRRARGERKAARRQRRPLVELLETRQVLSSEQWIAVIDGIPSGADLDEQLQNARALFE